MTREESLRLAAEKIRLKKEKEIREDNEFYARITSGPQWLIFKVIVAICTLMALLTTFEIFVDGPTKKLSEKDWKINREWEFTWHRVLDVEDYVFAPELVPWTNHVENSIEITYSPIFRTGKTLSFDTESPRTGRSRLEVVREGSIFTWFPIFQLFLLIPLVTFLFKRQKPWFNFARLLSMVFVFPGMLMVIYVALM